MRVRPTTWFLGCLLFFLAVVFLWLHRQTDALERERTAEAQPSPVQAGAEATPGTAEQEGAAAAEAQIPGGGRAHANPAHPHRLSNTDAPLRALARTGGAVLLRNAFIDTDSPAPLPIPEHLRSDGDPGSYIVQARGNITKAFVQTLRDAGAIFPKDAYIPNNAYLVQAGPDVAGRLNASPLVKSVIPYEPYFKLDPVLLGYAVEELNLPFSGKLRVTLFPDSKESALDKLERLRTPVMAENRSPFGPELIVLPNVGNWMQLAALPEVMGIERYFERVPMNDLTRPRVGVSEDSETPNNHLNLTGSGVYVAMNDSGGVDTNHADLAPRVLLGENTFTNDLGGHATFVAGIIGSSGANGPNGSDVEGSTNNANYRGMAPAANILAMDIGVEAHTDYVLAEWPARTNLFVFQKTNTFIVNNSWGYIGSRTYDSAAATWDAMVRDAIPSLSGDQALCAVFSVGNDGDGSQNGFGGVADRVESPATAKNVISVGAIDHLRNITNEFPVVGESSSNTCVTNFSAYYLGRTDSSNQVTGFSARGNVDPNTEGDFGRWKPDVVAPGGFAVSTRPEPWDSTNIYTSDTVQYIRERRTNLTIRPNSTNRYSIFIPFATTNLVISANDPEPTLALWIYTNEPPVTPSSSGQNIADTNNNSVSIPIPGGANTGDLLFDFVNTNDATIQFNLFTELTLTNCAAPFNNVLSNLNERVSPHNTTNGYRYHTGTSFSAPVVSGMLALMQEFFESTLPVGLRRTNSPAMMKALLINSARSLGQGYNYRMDATLNLQGWGLPNLTRMVTTNMSTLTDPAQWPVQMFDQSPTNSLATGQSHLYDVTVGANAQLAPLRVSLVWTDPPGNPAASMKLVNNLDLIVSNKITGDLYFGNSFSGGQDFTPIVGAEEDVVDPDTGLPLGSGAPITNDIVNNVENVYINSELDSDYAVYVVGASVNVNSVSSHTNEIVQDYALVISSGNPLVDAPFTVTQQTTITNANFRRVTFVDSNGTNGVALLDQRVGANSPLIVSTNGATNQWAFYVLTNDLGGTNAAFVTFRPPNLSRSRVAQADIDLFVSTDPGLTNLDRTVISNAVLNGLVSTRRGGTEFVTLSNSAAGDVFYVGVKSEDQQSAEFGFFSIFTDTEFARRGMSNEITLTAVGTTAVIPDGSPDGPRATNVFLINPFEAETLRRVVVTNTVTHELFGDLIGFLEKDDRIAVLNNNRGDDASAGRTFIYDDSDENDDPLAIPSDGPPTLNTFVGQDGSGLWTFTMVDVALNHTGSIDNVEMTLFPATDSTGGGGTRGSRNFDIGPGATVCDVVDIPSGAVSVEFNLRIISGGGPFTIRVRRDELPNDIEFDYAATGTQPGFDLPITVNDTPPLNPGRYFICIENEGADVAEVKFSFEIKSDYSVNPFEVFTTNQPHSVLDQALPSVNTDFDVDNSPTSTNTNNISIISITNTDSRPVTDIKVGVRLEHERASDTAIYLLSPTDTRILLWENRGALGNTNGLGFGTNRRDVIFASFTENTNTAFLPPKFVTNDGFVPFIQPVLTNTNIFLEDSGWSVDTNADANTKTEASSIIPTLRNEGEIVMSWEFFTVPDRMQIFYEGVEIFDTGWTNNQPKEESFLPGDVDTATDTITIAGHNFVQDDRLWFVSPLFPALNEKPGDGLPQGLTYEQNQATAEYFVFNVVGDTFQVSNSVTMAVVDLINTGNGPGPHYVYGGTAPFGTLETFSVAYGPGTNQFLEIKMNQGSNPNGTAWRYEFELLDAMGNSYDLSSIQANQWATDVDVRGGNLYLSGITDAHATNAIAARFALPLVDDDKPEYSFNWPFLRGRTRFASVAAASNSVLFAGDSYTETTDSSSNGKQVKGVVASVPPDQPAINQVGVQGSSFHVQVPAPTNGVFAHAGVELINGSVLAAEDGTNEFLYVTGHAQQNAANAGRMFLTKLQPDGIIEWTTNDYAGSDPFSAGHDVAFLNTNLYVAGVNADNGTTTNAYLAKFDTNGVPVWTEATIEGQYFGVASLGDAVYAAGTTAPFDVTTGTGLITKYDEAGNQVWSMTYAASTVLYDIVPFGNRVYAVGGFFADPEWDVVILEVLEDGTLASLPAPSTYAGVTTYGDGSGGDEIAYGAATDGFDLFVVGEMPRSGGTDSDAMILNYRVRDDILPEESLNELLGEAVGGDWKLEVWDSRIGGDTNFVPRILSWELRLGLGLTNSAPLPIVSGTTNTNTVTLDGLRYYAVNVPYTATSATITNESLTGGNLNLYFEQSGLPDPATSTNVGGPAALIVTNINLASNPVLVPGQRFFLAVQNDDPTETNEFRIWVTFDSTGTTFSAQGSPTSGSLAANSFQVNTYNFHVYPGESQVKFNLTNLTGDVQVYLRRNAVPNPDQHDIAATITDTNFASILIEPTPDLPDISGTWYARIENLSEESVTYEIEIIGDNLAPVIDAIPDVSVNEGAPLKFTVSATDSNPSQTLTFGLGSGAPGGASIDPASGEFSWTPNELEGPGTFPIDIVVTDDGNPNLSSTESFTVEVKEVNTAPVLPALGNLAVGEGTNLTVDAGTVDMDFPGNTLTYGLTEAPSGATIDSASGMIGWTPQEADGPGSHVFTVTVVDDGEPPMGDSRTFTVDVAEVNRAPVVAAIPDVEMDELTTFAWTNQVSDPDLPTNNLFLVLDAGAPDGMALDAMTGVLNWTPSEEQGPSTNVVTVSAFDDGSPQLSGSQSFTIVVNEVNNPPELQAVENQAIDETGVLKITNVVTDVDVPVQKLTFELTGTPPDGATIDKDTGVITWFPSEAHGPGFHTIEVTVTDDGSPALSDTISFGVAVAEVNEAPVVPTVTPKSVTEDSLLQFSLNATDPDIPANNLTMELAGGAIPKGASLHPETGAFTWNPTEAQGPGEYQFSFRVFDDGNPQLETTGIFRVTVGEHNQAPVLSSIEDRTVKEGIQFSFGVTTTDADLPANLLSYSLAAGAPAGASIDSRNGTFSWKPAEIEGPVSYPMTIRVVDDGSPALADEKTFTVTVVDDNSVPTIAPISQKTLDEGRTLNLTAVGSDIDLPEQTLTYKVEPGSPEGTTIDPVTGEFSWTPTEAQGPETHTVWIRVTDNGEPPLSLIRSFTVAVNEVNQAPVLAEIGTRTVTEGSNLAFNLSATDEDLPENSLTFELAAGAPSGVSVNPLSGLLVWKPAEAQGPSTNSITVKVTDNGSPKLSDTQTFTVIVEEENQAPVLQLVAGQSVNEGETLSLAISATDSDLPANQLQYSLEPEAPEGASIDPASGRFTWTPGEEHGPGTYSITVKVTDDGDPLLSDTTSFEVTVADVNNAPELAPIGDQEVNEGEGLFLQLSATDPDERGDTLTFELGEGAPEGLFLDPEIGELSWTPTEQQGPGDYEVTVRVVDDGEGNLSDSETFNIRVNEVNLPPVLEPVVELFVAEGETLQHTISAYDPDLPVQTVVLSLDSAPEGASLNPETGLLTWVVADGLGGRQFSFTVSATDDGEGNLSASETFTVNVTHKNTPPRIGAIADRTVNEGTQLQVQAVAVDDDEPADTLTFTLQGEVPDGMAIDAASGLILWTPSETQGPGEYPIVVRVTDNGVGALSDATSFNVSVGEVNVAPQLALVPDQVVDEGVLRSLRLSGSDADEPANSLSYSAVGETPAGLSVDAESGVVTWTPSEEQGPGSYDLTVRVEDDAGLGAERTFAIAVSEVNQAPVLPPPGTLTATEDLEFSHVVAASDEDVPANTLAFALGAEAPGGMTIDPASGRLTWIPNEQQGGSTVSVTVKLTDDGEPPLSTERILEISVAEDNKTPAITPIDNIEVDEGETLSVNVSATDADEPPDQLSYELVGTVPAGAGIDAASGRITWTPDEAAGPGTYTLSVRVTDDGAEPESATVSFTVTVHEVNAAPTLFPVLDQTVQGCSTTTLLMFATDSDEPKNTLTFSLGEDSLADVSIDSTSGLLTIDQPSTVGTHPVTVIVTDSGTPALTATQSFDVVVTEVPISVTTLSGGTAVSGQMSICSSFRRLYRFNVPQGSARALFELYDLDKNADLFLRKGDVPSATEFTRISENEGTDSERIVVQSGGEISDISGVWYLGIRRSEREAASFKLRATVPVEVEGGSILLSAEPITLETAPVVSTSEQPTITFPTVTGEKYVIEISADLMEWTVLTNIVVEGVDSTFTDPSPFLENIKRFYRIRQVPQ